MRSLAMQESTGLGSKIAIVLGAIVILMVIGLAIYGSAITPVQQSVEKVLPDGRFAR
ncbi:MAG: hypothetical protein WCD42_08080 [Rhizomicrobium sp.]